MYDFLWPIPQVGIGDSDGNIHNYAEPYCISIGLDCQKQYQVYKYMPLELKGVTIDKYNRAIEKADNSKKEENHNVLNNSLHHVAIVLNKIKYDGHSNHTAFSVWAMTFMKCQYVSWWHFWKMHRYWILGVG